MKIAIIPARGGSKRIPRKNIKEFFGKPVIAWSIIAAQNSMLFDHIIVSTDDEEIKSISENYGASVPFYRPYDLSDDHTSTAPVIAHAIKKINEIYNIKVTYACCIYPCSPLLNSNNLIDSFKILKSTKENFVYPVTSFPHSIYRSMKKSINGKMDFVFPDHELTRTQDLEETFHDAGQFYWGKAEAWIQLKKMHTNGIGMEIPSYTTVDIDNKDDWKRAELLFQSNKLKI
jgi:pseudaminic acid cytidylyltransferase